MKPSNKATMYLVYVGKNQFLDMTRKGSIHWSVMEVPESTYNLRNTRPKERLEDKCAKSPLSTGHKTELFASRPHG